MVLHPAGQSYWSPMRIDPMPTTNFRETRGVVPDSRRILHFMSRHGGPVHTVFFD